MTKTKIETIQSEDDSTKPQLYPRKRLISVSGDSKLEIDNCKWQIAERLGTILISSGFRILTGGMFGVAEAVCRGARLAPEFSDGDIVGLLPGGSPEEGSPFVGIAIPTGIGLARNVLVASGDAVIAIGGGAGTLSEVAYAWMYKRLIIAFRVAGWSGKLADTKIDERRRFEHIPEDKVFGADTPEDALATLRLMLPKYSAQSTEE